MVGKPAPAPYITAMTDAEFDAALVDAAFTLAAAEGWRKVSAAAAARHAGLDLSRARDRFSGRGAVLKRFGALADAHALTSVLPEGSVKDRLFDILLRRFDFLQTHRAGVVGLLRILPLDPALGAWLGAETLKSMGWMLEGAGVSSRGVRGGIRKRGLAAVWAWGLRAWLRDETADLSATMAAIDTALLRAEQIASRFSRDGFVPETGTSGLMPETGTSGLTPETDTPGFMAETDIPGLVPEADIPGLVPEATPDFIADVANPDAEPPVTDDFGLPLGEPDDLQDGSI